MSRTINYRRIDRWVIVALLALSTVRADAQQPPMSLDTLYATPALMAVLQAASTDSVYAYCAPSFSRWRFTVKLDSLRPAARALNPDCGPREATLLMRPDCIFTLHEFVLMRPRALYVVLLCRSGGVTRAFGIPLGHMPPLERITEEEEAPFTERLSGAARAVWEWTPWKKQP